ncbi:MAG: Fe-S cluster assembly protein SufD [Puniceicoccales bacterium]|jgi:Fe-S cluster assembly protein SufD|nr:Fe-S cluster assembly protein SufD [Puniceicoccales bacterium]
MSVSVIKPESFEQQQITNESVQSLSLFRHLAWARFHQEPFPRKDDEQWRFSSINSPYRPCLDKIAVTKTPPNDRLLHSLLQRSNLIKNSAATSIFFNGNLIRSGAPELRNNAPDIILETFEEAAQNHPETLSRFFFKQSTSPLGGRKFLALNHAYLKDGYVLIVPAGVKLDAPIVTYNWISGRKRAVFPTLLVIAGEKSSVSLVDFFFANKPENDTALAISSASLHAAAGAKVSRVAVQNWGHGTFAYQFDNINAEQDSDVHSVSINLGSIRLRTENSVHLNGRGARARLHGLSIASENQEFDQRTLQVHNAPTTFSDLRYKNVLLDRARTIFSGLIRVTPDAQKTDAYQTNRNLLLSPFAEANSLPGLEIGANDVRCSHGATNSQINDEELFYLQSRGVPSDVARELLISGFFEEIIEKAGNDDIAAALRDLLKEKLLRNSK